ncbi:alpha/beta hydrolase [Chryseobacterium herbae]|uniref:Alpha/beta fold hydrolase n=1 Tax=Chryseobacterium herbae TaxID=2976476 RepID=A0ABT2J0W2_9FLAO|nr:alpha/beta hydrolase [Chryseobacterium sp. pc1-10]MCT2564485.1 alpha/beta fold hydrolase [Chryseobacterium sp. pc1-10]
MITRTSIFTTAFSLLLLLFACTDGMHDEALLVPKTVEEDSSLPSVFINGRHLHAEAFGNPNNTLIVCVHGGPGADYRYLLNAKDLAKHGYRVVFYDQTGSGLSQRYHKSYYDNLDIDDIFITELRGVIAKYKTNPNQKVILLGHSWGAMLATAYAGKYPSEIAGLALFEPGGLQWDDVITYIMNSQTSGAGGESLEGNSHEILDYNMSLAASADNINTGDPGLKPEDFWRMGAILQMVAIEKGEKSKPDFSTNIGQFTKPVFFGYGDNKAYPDSWAQKISSPFNNKNLHKFNNTGHSGMFTNKEIWTHSTLPKLLNYFKSL